MSIKVLPYQLKKQINIIKNDFFYPSLKTLNGNILEIGFGKGNNLGVYPDRCKVYAIDKTKEHINNPNPLGNKNIVLKKGIAEEIPYKDDFFDAVVFSFVLCSVNSVDKTIQEIKRVLKKGGRVILLEHIKSENKISHFVQKAITVIQSFFVSCHMDRDPRPILKKNFKVVKEEYFNNSLEPYIFMEMTNE